MTRLIITWMGVTVGISAAIYLCSAFVTWDWTIGGHWRLMLLMVVFVGLYGALAILCAAALAQKGGD